MLIIDFDLECERVHCNDDVVYVHVTLCCCIIITIIIIIHDKHCQINMPFNNINYFNRTSVNIWDTLKFSPRENWCRGYGNLYTTLVNFSPSNFSAIYKGS